MKITKIIAHSTKEAIEIAKEQGIKVVRNVTPSYQAQDDINTEDELRDFAEKMLKKNRLADQEGVGCIVVQMAGSADTRKRPYEFINHKNNGPSKKVRVFEVQKKSDGQVIGTALSKKEAIYLAKNKMREYREDLICKQCYRILGENEIAFALDYVPSINTKEGIYIVFSN